MNFALQTSDLDFPRWIAVVTTPPGFLIVHVAVPFGISRLSVHHGWVDGLPGVWNHVALIVVVAGATAIVWGAGLHVANTPARFGIEATPSYLLKGGPYRYSRNPIYVGVLTLWFGWALFYGSLSMLLAFAVATLIVTFIVVPWEERSLEARFGEIYLAYKNSVPRWLGSASPRV